jgi:hypothetical protein
MSLWKKILLESLCVVSYEGCKPYRCFFILLLFPLHSMFRFQPDAPSLGATLYKEDGLGGLVVRGLLEGWVCQEILAEVRGGPFIEAPRSYGVARQEFDHYSLGERDKPSIRGDIRDFPLIRDLRSAYTSLYAGLFPLSLQDVALDSIAVHRYPVGSLGLSRHRDASRYVYVIGIFVLAGQAPFYLYEGKNREPALDLAPNPGDFILLRAPFGDVDRRPPHAVGRVSEERFSVTFRAPTKKGRVT